MTVWRPLNEAALQLTYEESVQMQLQQSLLKMTILIGLSLKVESTQLH